MAWYVDRGLAKLIEQWRERHPGAIVGTIGDEHHTPPSQHLPEEDGSVDAGDFMPGNGVTDADLDALAEALRASRDPRIAYVIRRQRIFSSTNSPWEWRTYDGAYHGHTHVSVNDRHENDSSEWAISEVDDMTPEELAGADIWTNPYGDAARNPTISLGTYVRNTGRDTRETVEAIREVRADVDAMRAQLDAMSARPVVELDYAKLVDELFRRIATGQAP